MIACSVGEKEKLMSHVVGAYFVDLEELFVNGFVCIDVLGVYAVLPNIF